MWHLHEDCRMLIKDTMILLKLVHVEFLFSDVFSSKEVGGFGVKVIPGEAGSRTDFFQIWNN